MMEITALSEAVITDLDRGAPPDTPSAWLLTPTSKEMVRISLPIRTEDEVVLIRVVIMAINTLMGSMPVVVTLPVTLDAHGHLEPIDYQQKGERDMLLLIAHLDKDSEISIYHRRQGIWLKGQGVEAPWPELEDINQTLHTDNPMYARLLDILCEAGLITQH